MAAKYLRNLIAIAVLVAIPVYAWSVLEVVELYVRETPSGSAGGLNLRLMHRVELALMKAGIEVRGVVLDAGGVTVRLAGADGRDHAMDVLNTALGPNCTVLADAAPAPR